MLNDKIKIKKKTNEKKIIQVNSVLREEVQ